MEFLFILANFPFSIFFFSPFICTSWCGTTAILFISWIFQFFSSGWLSKINHWRKWTIDNYIDWSIKNGTFVAVSTGCTENWSLFRIWCSCINIVNGYICINCTLVGLHMVCWFWCFFFVCLKWGGGSVQALRSIQLE